MPTPTNLFVERSIFLLSHEYLPKLTRTLAALTEAVEFAIRRVY